MTILIITDVEDVHADAVIANISQLRDPRSVVRVNAAGIASNAQFSLSREGHWQGGLTLADSGRRVSLAEVTSVWFRKPQPVRPPIGMSTPASREYVTAEYGMLLRSLYGLIAHRFWVSPYWSIQRAGLKLPNLELASRLGLATPRSLVSNDPIHVRDFCELCDWSVLAKPFALASFEMPGESGSWAPFAARFDRETFEKHASAIRLAPIFVQEYIRKTIEIRVTVIGKKIFAAALASQGIVGAEEDWRAVDVENIPHEPYELPQDIEAALLNFNRHYDLQFSTFDLIVDDDNRHVFLECNPNGQWLWIESLTRQPLARAMANLLLNPTELSLGVVH